MKKRVVALLNTAPVLVLLLVECVGIASANAGMKRVFTQIDPIYAAWWRLGWAALVLLLWRRPWRKSHQSSLPKTWKEWAMLAVLGTTIAAMNCVFYIGISSLNVGVAVAIEFIGPLAVAVWSGRSWREYAGITLAFCGLLMLAGNSLTTIGVASLPGLIAIILSGALWGVYIILARKNSRSGNPLDTLSISIGLGFIVQTLFIGVPAFNSIHSPKATATWGAGQWGWLYLILATACVAIGASILPYVMDQIFMRRVTASRFSVMQAVLPAMNLFIGILLGDIPGLFDYFGVGIIVFAVVISFSGDDNPVGLRRGSDNHYVEAPED